jgi:TrmH family RNA methyltransferase
VRAHRLIPAGPAHPRVRQYLNLRDNRAPHRRDAVALEGLWMVRAAADHGASIEALLVCPDLWRGELSGQLVDRLALQGVPAFTVSARTFARLARREGPDGLAGIATVPSRQLEQLELTASARLLVLDGFELAGNVGSLLRCADAAGADAVVVTNLRVRLNHPVLLKASMGTVFSMPLCATTAERAAAWLTGAGFRLLAADPAGPVSYRRADYGPWTAIVLGSERYGLSDFWKQAAHQIVAIPMLGRADSLNVGHAGALLLYEALHRQGTPPGAAAPAPE